MRNRPEECPGIYGVPVIEGPKILEWPADREEEGPSLGDPTANLVNDFHAGIGRCDMVLSTSGNYHMALRELWNLYLDRFPPDAPLRNWVYTTSPPLAGPQIESGIVRIGNVTVRCRPQVAAGPRAVIDSLTVSGAAEGPPIPFVRSRGNVLLVQKGNPLEIRSVWDLGRREVRVVTPNPLSEPGSFMLYAGSLYGIAKNDRNPPGDATAEDLFNAVFNGGRRRRGKWLAGRSIHHREIPWSIACGRGDVAVIFYHLAAHAVGTFPDLFDIVPLGGTPGRPKPLPGNLSEVLYAVAVKGRWSARQRAATRKLLEVLLSPEATAVFERHGLARP